MVQDYHTYVTQEWHNVFLQWNKIMTDKFVLARVQVQVQLTFQVLLCVETCHHFFHRTTQSATQIK